MTHEHYWLKNPSLPGKEEKDVDGNYNIGRNKIWYITEKTEHLVLVLFLTTRPNNDHMLIGRE